MHYKMKVLTMLLALFYLVLWGCNGNRIVADDDAVEDGEADDTGGSDLEPTDTTADRPEGEDVFEDIELVDGVLCYDLGHPCTTGIDCCSGSCEPDISGSYVCTSDERCTGLGDPCEVAADCCSLGCDGSVCVEDLCLLADEGCTDDAQCCSNRCVAEVCESGGACLPAGENCTSGGSSACCSLNCMEASDGIMRCGGLGRCRSEGEVCMENSDCCNYQCEGGFCLVMPECVVAGEACDINEACCSSVCADDGSGYRSCQFLGGCRPFGELCRSDAECCNDPAFGGPGVCEPIAEGLGRCLNPTGCAPAGELCEPGYHDCCPCGTPDLSPGCPNPSGDEFCLPTIYGVLRCFSDDCVIEGGPCEDDEDCCGGICTDGICGEGFECLDDLEPCAFSDQCCCLICAPDEEGGLVCCPGGGECVPEGGSCTSDADCCSGRCNRDGICGPPDTTCVPVGGSCTSDDDCCSDHCDPVTGTCGSGLI